MAGNFTDIPILDYALLSTDKRPEFILQLRHALINVGFLYLANPPVDKSVVDSLLGYVPPLFALPQDEKDAIGMVNSQHFLGYTRLGSELTKGAIDQREQFDFGTEFNCRWKPGEPEYKKLHGEAQWPNEDLIPGFRSTMLKYLSQVEALSYEFIKLLAEALGLKSDALSEFFDEPGNLQHRAKIVKYPDLGHVGTNQGVGPHFDGGFLTFLLQASPHRGLQVQNLSGEWIDAPPISDTFVVNIGKALEAVTQNLAKATSHRVLSPPAGSTPRYSIPFFQNIRSDIKLTNHVPDFPQEILKLKELRGPTAASDSVNYGEYDRETTGKVSLIGRVRSHPDVAQRHYPDLFEQFFPNSLPLQGGAY